MQKITNIKHEKIWSKYVATKLAKPDKILLTHKEFCEQVAKIPSEIIEILNN